MNYDPRIDRRLEPVREIDGSFFERKLGLQTDGRNCELLAELRNSRWVFFLLANTWRINLNVVSTVKSEKDIEILVSELLLVK